ncbi:hypothetical protein P152DRAFT_139115 [Eremomyces bilateralis CBS 781.70]|uniref:Uncharacterized protein n=1 Tax=Eremomyces bilateralis CBS 781.70 TaxID=1392243 RepID=A0A6G1FWJ5_9PEZI|nr:uncharacterized protein P152DRAFT_139115 [Eremomyces bilateralis CBS 781.70]KAF1810072.1 hypothetical protein P152DRAFT_139115 [Eremomyces bilateralis CBS 781.70]
MSHRVDDRILYLSFRWFKVRWAMEYCFGLFPLHCLYFIYYKHASSVSFAKSLASTLSKSNFAKMVNRKCRLLYMLNGYLVPSSPSTQSNDMCLIICTV